MAEAWRGIEADEAPPGPADSPVPAGYGPLDRGRDRTPVPPGRTLPPEPPAPSSPTGPPHGDEGAAHAAEPVAEAERPAGFAALAESLSGTPAGTAAGEPGTRPAEREPVGEAGAPPPADASRPPGGEEALPSPSPPPREWSGWSVGGSPDPVGSTPPAAANAPGDPPTAPTPAVPPPAGRRSRTVAPPTAAQRSLGESELVRGPVRGRLRPHQEVRLVRGVRARRMIRRIDVVTVFKVSVAFYLLVMLTLLIAGTVVWNVADAFGLISSIQKSIRTLFSLKSFTLHAGAVFGWSLVIGAVLCLFGALLNTLMAVTYNLLSDVVGGIQVVVVSETDAA